MITVYRQQIIQMVEAEELQRKLIKMQAEISANSFKWNLNSNFHNVTPLNWFYFHALINTSKYVFSENFCGFHKRCHY